MFIPRNVLETGARNLYVEAVKTHMLAFDTRSVPEKEQEMTLQEVAALVARDVPEEELSLRDVAALVTRDIPKEEMSLRDVAALVTRSDSENDEISLKDAALLVTRGAKSEESLPLEDAVYPLVLRGCDHPETACVIGTAVPIVPATSTTKSIVAQYQEEKAEQPQFTLAAQTSEQSSLPPPPSPSPKHNMPESTEHLLIAAGSIGATIFLALFVFAFYMMKKKGMTFADLVRYPSRRRAARESQMTNPEDWRVKGNAWGVRSSTYRTSKALSSDPSVLRNPSTSSNRPLLKSNSFPAPRMSLDRRPTDASMSDLEKQDFVAALPRKPLATYSNPAPPAYQERETTQRTSIDASGNQPRTFRQFLAARQSTLPTPKNSRFSWATTQAAQTPRDANFAHTSVSTSRTSVPRFRTIQSWVRQQSDNVSADALEERYGSKNAPEVPNVPAEYQEKRSSVAMAAPRISREQSRGHARRQTNASEATVFRHHPGDEVVIQRGSTVPSDILDRHAPPTRL